jgi:glycine cleavage system H lipoate-binding protein
VSEISKISDHPVTAKMTVTGTITRADGTVEELGVLESADVIPVIDPVSGEIVSFEKVQAKKPTVIQAIKDFFAPKEKE